MSLRERIHTPGTCQTTETLITAYTNGCFPTPFHEGEDPDLARIVYQRISEIPFSQYWRDLFESFKRYNGDPAGYFAQQIFRKAETSDGVELYAYVAEMLADRFPDRVLEADVESPILNTDQAGLVGLSPLAKFLKDRRNEFESATVKFYPAPPEISDTWISFVNALATANPELHQLVVDELRKNYTDALIETDAEIEEWEGVFGGYDSLDQRHELKRTIAKILSHFPDIVISGLKKPFPRSAKENSASKNILSAQVENLQLEKES